MIKSINQLDLNKKYSYADYLTWAFDEYVELIKGKISKMSPAPSRQHQEIAFKLSFLIGKFLEGKPCHAFFAPFDVRLEDKKKSKDDKKVFTVVQPDICVVCDEDKLDDRGCIGAPDWIIEIISPATQKKDLTVKYDLYEEAGVKEYWIVQPNDQTLSVFQLDKSGKYAFQGLYPNDAEVDVGVFPGFKMDLGYVFKSNK